MWQQVGGRAPGFPAHAGMDRRPPAAAGASSRFPRTRGDGPGGEKTLRPTDAVSPHTRGWTGAMAGKCPPRRGFPAHAGMDPAHGRAGARRVRLPRTRGDGPRRGRGRTLTPRASPHTRGWTRADRRLHPAARGFPAHAGMDPGATTSNGHRWRLPRTRGDGPARLIAAAPDMLASPHTRGWTPIRVHRPQLRPGFPAHAGMDRGPRMCRTVDARLPRTRGDGPGGASGGRSGSQASPHTRGWTRPILGAPVARFGFPAHAGMDRPEQRSSPRRVGLPRTRGDGPA